MILQSYALKTACFQRIYFYLAILFNHLEVHSSLIWVPVDGSKELRVSSLSLSQAGQPDFCSSDK